MDPVERYPDLFGEALSHSSSQAAQMISLTAAATEVAVARLTLRNARRAEQDERGRRALLDAERAARERARVRWAPAHDARWLGQANLFQVAGVWGAAAAYADDDLAATAALRRSEERLRVLHPYAMARYDRIREEGASPHDAMREAGPLFGREPQARPGDPGGRRVGIGASSVSADIAAASSPGPAEREAVRLASESFPRTVSDGIRAAATGGLQESARSPVRTATNKNATKLRMPK